MDRRDKLISGLDLRQAVGIEIGPLDRPIVRREDGRILYVDHVDTAALRKKYANDPNVDVSRLPEVDAVWGAQTLQEAIGPDRKVDYVVASHVVEHVPDLITWLEELHTVLKPGGEVRLAIPDRRFTFDHLRRETSLADILSARLARARRPQAIAILDHCLNVVRLNRVEAWEHRIDPTALEKVHTADLGIQLARDSLENGAYHDVHCWVFTPRSFATLLARASSAGLVRFACRAFHDTERHHDEFFVSLRPCDDPTEAAESWRRMERLVATHVAPPRPDAAAPAADLTPQIRRLEELAARHAALLRAHDERDAGERDRVRRELDAVFASTSWKLTAPLRRAVDAVRRRRGPAA